MKYYDYSQHANPVKYRGREPKYPEHADITQGFTDITKTVVGGAIAIETIGLFGSLIRR